jgi:hypothetical protein
MNEVDNFYAVHRSFVVLYLTRYEGGYEQASRITFVQRIKREEEGGGEEERKLFSFK